MFLSGKDNKMSEFEFTTWNVLKLYLGLKGVSDIY